MNTTDQTITDWLDELIASTPGLQDPEGVRYVLLGVEDREWAAEFVRREVPTFPMPTLPIPAWVTRALPWEWESDYQGWTRDLEHTWPEGEREDTLSVTLTQSETVSADGSITRSSGGILTEALTGGTRGAEVRQFAARLHEAADVLDGIHGAKAGGTR